MEIFNPFEFQRQQNDQIVSEPELSHFKASQCLEIDDVEFGVNAKGKAYGEARVGFKNDFDAKKGLEKDRATIGSRFIKIFPIRDLKQYNSRLKHSRTNPYHRDPKPSDNRFSLRVIRARGFPYTCTGKQVKEFFEGVHIEEQIFGIKQNGEFAGEVYIEFRTLDDATAAMKFNRRTMKNVKPERYVQMFRLTMNKFELFKYHMTPQSTPIAPIPTPPVPIPFSIAPIPIPSSPIIPQVNMEYDEAYMSWYYNVYLPFVCNQYGYGVQYDPSTSTTIRTT
uniref:RRM domain-containing protein n=1 Tax=Panagrolaimus sp. PS1159 TaxID=55785 RepID=A0AC35FX47_9BILA